jgi:DNA-binding MarR family transcriptional regulator
MRDCSSKHFGQLMSYCDHQVHKLMNRELQKYDVSPMQCHVLMHLYQQGGEDTQRNLQQVLMVKPSTVNGIVDRLEQKGMVTRTVSASDGRSKLLRLTDKGREFHSAFVEVWKYVHEKMERGFSAGELTQLEEYLLRVADNLVTEEKE